MTAARIHILIASLMAALGIALWARAAHGGGIPSLITAAQFFLLHAIAVLALTACRKLSLVHDALARWSIAVLLIGTCLFAGDLTLRALAGSGLSPMAAPVGGSLLILGWLMMAVAGALQQRVS
jgi:uncharacterized membrane protein YgdD (TMEM256/DUF423 family)